jgi:hypothetical protein
VAAAGLGLLGLIAHTAQAVTVAAALLLQSLVRKRTTLEAVGAVDILLHLRQQEMAGSVEAVEAETAGLMLQQELLIQAAAVGVGQAVVLLEPPVVQALLLFVVAEQRLPSQAHLQLQWLAVTLYIHSLATDQ